MFAETKNDNIPFHSNRTLTFGDLQKFKSDLLIEFRQIVREAITGKAQKKWMKSNEVRRLLSISPGTLQTMRNIKVISFIKIGGTIYYDREDIHTMFEKNKVVNINR